MKRSKNTLTLILAIIFIFSSINVFASANVSKSNELSYDGEQIYEKSHDAVFYIRSLNEDGTLKLSGSGFVFTKNGYALTAAHVVKNASSINAVFEDGIEIVGLTVEKYNEELDIAVLKFPPVRKEFPYLQLSKNAPNFGEQLYALGYPLKTVKIITDGIVSVPYAVINGTERLLITAPLSSGMSGGPIICKHGEVIGLSSGTLKTMNGISISPTVKQINDTVTPFTEGVK